MGRPNVFAVATTLYHPAEGARTFPAGETDPGGMWSERIGGDLSAATSSQALKDLITAQDTIEALEARLTAAARDLAESAQTRDQALAQVAGLEQRVIAAEAAQAAAEALATQYMRERDEARSGLTAKPAKAEAVKA